ncbi:GrpB family protein [Halorarum halobium]|uniref:GrpB family protein n=1 Tax=Halorarum halobium TaxID=3075121 RepID=UPI0028A9D62F|nr:GrpB family protein [Halobaculum sp. XH14]
MVGLARGTVELREWTPAWRRAYEREVARLRDLVGESVIRFDHVGSTAVEGLAAKPVVDVLATVPDVGAVAELVATLEANGYERRPDDVAGRVFLAKGPPEDRTHYLSLTEAGSEYRREKLAFRDHLREHPHVAAAYESLKRDLADEFPDDREAYTRRKAAFIERTLADAMDD